MALINNREISVWDFVFVIIGLFSIAWFFYDYDNQHPKKLATSSLDRQSATLHAVETLSSLGYSVTDFENEISFSVRSELLDSLQKHQGRRNLVRMLSDSSISGIYPYYWQVTFLQSRKEDSVEIQLGDEESTTIAPGNTVDITVELDPGGRWIGLLNSDELLPSRKVRRDLLKEFFNPALDSSATLWPAATDSMLNRLLQFDLDRERSVVPPGTEQFIEMAQERVNRQRPLRISRDGAYRIGKLQLARTGWDTTLFRRDTVVIERFKNINGARVRFQSKQKVLGQTIAVQTVLSPTGSLLELESSYPRERASSALPGGSEWQLLRVVLFLFFCIAAAVIFFFRIRARVVDTQAALVVSIIGGLMLPIVIFLGEIDEISLFASDGNWMQIINLAIIVGITGAGSSIGFFVFSAIGDSITRQHWPEKLSSYDYLRQGMIFNKPLGLVMVRSVVLTFILAGLWNTLLWLFPKLYIHISEIFISTHVAWPVLYFLFDNLWFSLMVILGIFLIVGSQAYAQTRNTWLAGGVMVLAVAVMAPVSITVASTFYGLLLFAGLGVGLTLIYLKWDFLTLFLTHFLFVGLLDLSSAWMIPNSPDTYILVFYLLLLLFLVIGGTLSIFLGKKEKALPGYIPEYVEELAQEERIKQELQIAREVQRSFLPSSTPDIAGLDLAAICKPAYETGGDYYDFIPLDNRRVAVVIGDVSGKGIQAAFYMTFIKGILHSLCREIESPSELLKKANSLFYANAQRGTFVSLIYGILDLEKNRFSFARAGHNPIIHHRQDESRWEELKPTGLGLGLTPGETFDENMSEITLDVDKDDILILYTDGIVEALNSARQFYGSDRLLEVLKKSREKSAAEILDGIASDVKKFVGQAQQHDDMTMLVIKYGSDE